MSVDKIEFADEELRERLSAEQYAVTQRDATEPAFSGCFWDDHEPGVYACVVCGAELFRSDEKFESGSGWPSSGSSSSEAITRLSCTLRTTWKGLKLRQPPGCSAAPVYIRSSTPIMISAS